MLTESLDRLKLSYSQMTTHTAELTRKVMGMSASLQSQASLCRHAFTTSGVVLLCLSLCIRVHSITFPDACKCMLASLSQLHVSIVHAISRLCMASLLIERMYIHSVDFGVAQELRGKPSK